MFKNKNADHVARLKRRTGASRTHQQPTEMPNGQVEISLRSVPMSAIVKNIVPGEILSRVDQWLTRSTQIVSYIEATASNANRLAKQVYFVTPILPHPCEIEIWNGVVKKLGVKGTIITSKSEEKGFKHFLDVCAAIGTPSYLECKTLDGITENKTFLAGLESEITNANLIVAVGESSLASYQALKARSKHQGKLVIWQNSPRNSPFLASSRNLNPVQASNLAREKTVRREILKNCDALICFDKDSATWSYLEEVNAQRIRRVSRGINLARFSQEFTASRRIEMREKLGLPDADFIFLQAGPLEVEAGAIDSVFAFKSLLQSHPNLLNHTKLVFCGTGAAGADVRQAVVDLKLDDHVFFLNPNDENTLQVLGNQLSNLLVLCDAVLHTPIAPVNGSPLRYLDCTYDIFCALASGLTVISNGHGWVGEWIARFYRIFSTGSIHSQAKLMHESIEKQERMVGLKRAVRMAIENELALDKAVDELSRVMSSLLTVQYAQPVESVSHVIDQIEKTVQARQYVEAIQLISNAFKMPGLSEMQRANLFRHIGDCFTKLGDLENGLQNYARSLDLDPYNAKTFIGLGTIALQTHNYNVAVPQFQKAVSLSPRDEMASLGLGLAFEGLGEPKEALNWTIRSCNLNIENTVALYNVVKLAYDLDQFNEAEEILTRYVGLHPNDVNMKFSLGGLAFKNGKMNVTRQLMEDILVLDPMNSRAHGLLSQVNKENEKSKRAS